ncbi:hypothetical protein LT493_34970 [Streptomyces tricolor]|nr:hypothetical protein [Streptomyces tricolor]
MVVTCRAAEYEDLIRGGAPGPARGAGHRGVPGLRRRRDRLPAGRRLAARDRLVTRLCPAALGGRRPGRRRAVHPLMVTSARLVYQRLRRDPAELLDGSRFDCRFAVEQHLTDRLIDAAYAPGPGPTGGAGRDGPWTAAQGPDLADVPRPLPARAPGTRPRLVADERAAAVAVVPARDRRARRAGARRRRPGVDRAHRCPRRGSAGRLPGDRRVRRGRLRAAVRDRLVRRPREHTRPAVVHRPGVAGPAAPRVPRGRHPHRLRRGSRAPRPRRRHRAEHAGRPGVLRRRRGLLRDGRGSPGASRSSRGSRWRRTTGSTRPRTTRRR